LLEPPPYRDKKVVGVFDAFFVLRRNRGGYKLVTIDYYTGRIDISSRGTGYVITEERKRYHVTSPRIGITLNGDRR
jgi:hypothetical protein